MGYIRISWKERFISIRGLGGIIAIFTLIMGGLFAGVFTPTEAGAVGTFGTLVLAIAGRRLSWQNLSDALLEAAKTTCIVFTVIIGILMFTHFIALSGLTSTLANFLIEAPVPPMVVLIGIMALYLFLGMFIDSRDITVHET